MKTRTPLSAVAPPPPPRAVLSRHHKARIVTVCRGKDEEEGTTKRQGVRQPSLGLVDLPAVSLGIDSEAQTPRYDSVPP